MCLVGLGSCVVDLSGLRPETHLSRASGPNYGVDLVSVLRRLLPSALALSLKEPERRIVTAHAASQRLTRRDGPQGGVREAQCARIPWDSHPRTDGQLSADRGLLHIAFAALMSTVDFLLQSLHSTSSVPLRCRGLAADAGKCTTSFRHALSVITAGAL